MARPPGSDRRRPTRGALLRGGIAVLVSAGLVGGAIVAQGFDEKQAPVRNPSVWAINQDTRTGSPRYARVNTDLAELDTVKPAGAPSSIVQTADAVVVLTDDDLKYGVVDPARPPDLVTDDDALESAPPGTQSVTATGDRMAFLSSAGSVSTSVVSAAGVSAPAAVDPFPATDPHADPDPYSAAAIAIGTDGTLYAYSSGRRAVLAFDLATGVVVDETRVAAVPDDPAPQLTAVGDAWVLFDGTGRFWTREHPQGVDVDLGGADQVALEAPAASGSSVFAATVTGLYELDLDDLAVSTPIAPGPTLGTPAAPRRFRGVTYAAWLPAGGTAGTLWRSDRPGPAPLSFGTATAGAQPAPVLRDNGSELILNDDASGWVWTADGTLVASSQDWAAGDPDRTTIGGDAEVTQIRDPLPPIATDDAFGVRAGELASLPVLLNDHDPNDDVLTIVPGSVTGLDPAFGEARITSELGRVAVRVADHASGTAGFSYQITDGDDAHRVSATVRLTVVDDDAEHAPAWCGGDPVCAEVTPWPSMQVAPGGTASAQVLNGWVDPESDPVYVASAVKKNPADPGSVAVGEDGTVYFQHPDAAAAAGAPVTIQVTVADARGDTGERDLTVSITSAPVLTATPFSATTSIGRELVIDPAAHIQGADGAFSLANATTTFDAASVAVGADATSLEVSSTVAGTFVVRFDVDDARTTGLSAFVRVTVLPDDELRLTTAPITVFVRPTLDTTVDVFAAVSNPADRLLVLESATTHQRGGNALFADVVGHRLLRVKGSTANGGPGVLGTVDYVVSDGTADADRRVTGVATVILLDAQDAQRPIAVDDAVVVRAGAQVDVPVLANDVATDGNALVLDPSADATASDGDGGLAFASGDVVRVLAPQTAGTYTIRYTVYSAGAPAKADTGDILVTVTATGDNQKPRPRALDARVAAGQTVTIPFDGHGVDPDGDAVLLSRIASQPAHGAASIAPDGASIRYTALDASYAGTDEFQYEVRDPQGAVGTATVRVGILAARESSTPVTFTDYVQVEQGDNRVVVRPLDNDIDPLGGTLVLSDLVPDLADPASPQYAEQAALVAKVDGGEVTVLAGPTAGTRVFRYTASTADGLNSATGYVVVKIVPSAVPDAPRITDSYVGVDDRATFENDGLDVVAGHVTWLSGDVSALRLELWHPPAGFTVTGHRIAGPLPDASTLVPFSLTGEDYQGRTVTSYGFLLVPGERDIILTLRAGAGVVRVDENQSTTFDLASLVAVPRGATLEVDAKGIGAVLRTAATCELESGLTVRYTAGEGSPYADACAVPVRLAGQEFYTPLLVPVQVEAEAPVPLLRDASREVVPDPQLAPQTLDLMSMVGWAGAKTDDANIAFTVTNPDPAVWDVHYDPATRTVSFAALGSAVSGTRGTIGIAFAGTYGSSAARGVVNLVVGATPNVQPRGGSTTVECSIATDRGDCRVTAIGLPGEYNYFADAGALTIAQLVPSVCPGVTFSVSGRKTVSATWSGDIDGVECTLGFVVEDPSGDHHRSTGDGNGTITWRFNGVPRAPASVRQIAYDDQRIQLTVDPGDARSAFPALGGFDIVMDGGDRVVAQCTADGSCGPIRTSANLDHHVYTAYATNSEGRSATGPSVEAWSYALPRLGKVTVEPVYDPGITSRTAGAVRVTIGASERSVTAYSISGAGGAVARSGDSTVAVVSYPVGRTDITVTPVTSGDPPSGSGPKAADAAATSTTTVAGSPAITADGSVAATESSVTLSGVTVDANRSAKPTQLVYFAYQSAPPTCVVDPSGGAVQATGGDAVVSATPTISGLQRNRVYHVGACATNGFGFAATRTQDAYTAYNPGVGAAPLQYTVSDGTTTTVGGVAYNTSGWYPLTIVDESAGAPVDPDNFTATWQNYDTATHTASLSNQDPAIAVVYCAKRSLGTYCPARKDATPQVTNREYQLSVQGQSGVTCDATLHGFSARNVGSLGGTPAVVSARYYAKDGTELTGIDPTNIPSTVYQVKDVTVAITWTDDRVSALAPYLWDAGDARCSNYQEPSTPTPEPTDPTPEPTTTP
ncbi:Ig-like domain-containing protein [Galbitalea sp. SE-J8]|uniref:Ig-like domain-containing protein n=1 Tax=Galbitalea sp. SE-J8 TaxID=3054952 RepID=UPI00259C7675|nr:Ig-like domain-containing protein [Galbitalea sp. SE-J8]MDM4761539.1 Ig-like domain-containing protein [Galbitalea sp. SE-J8]